MARNAAWLAWIVPFLVAAAGAATAAPPEGFVQPRDGEGRFTNLERREPRSFAFWRWKWDQVMGRTRKAPARAPVPVVAPDLERLRTPPGQGEGARLTWVGHATFLVQMDGKSFLTDPVLSDSLPGFISRNVPPAIPRERLPRIDAVLVSHNHYDHMDLATLSQLRAPVVAGLGQARVLGRARLAATELGWWQSTEVGGVRITFVPAQHFSQRSIGDRNETLWGGFVLEGSSATVYHSGDTAYFGGFRQIGERFAIDAALLPVGAYDPAWFMEVVHMNPEQALQAFLDLGARTFVAMHWGTFKLSDEPLEEPPRRVEAERRRRGLAPEVVRILAVGETIEVRRPLPVAAHAGPSRAPGPPAAAARGSDTSPAPPGAPPASPPPVPDAAASAPDAAPAQPEAPPARPPPAPGAAASGPDAASPPPEVPPARPPPGTGGPAPGTPASVIRPE